MANAIVICAGHESKKDLNEKLVSAGRTVHLIGGAELAVELDAKVGCQAGD